jgi:glycosyltransferase involved in cell wall biosynthesis
MSRRIRAAVLMGHPVQHFSPGLRLLADRSDLEPIVYYWNAGTDGVYDPGFGRHVRWDGDLHTGYPWWSPPAGSPARRGLELLRRLRRDRPDVILSFGWASITARLGIGFAALTGTPLLYYGDSNWRSSASGRGGRVRGLVLRMLFRASAGAVSTGASNREFYLAHGMPCDRIHYGVYPTGVEAFAAAGRRREPVPSSNDDDRPVLIGFAGKFLPIKAADDLIEAAARLPRAGRWQLWLIGDGPQRPQLERLVRDRELTDRVRFLGFRNTNELPPLYAAVDVMVMPSRREPRGLVAIEAMAAGAAVVVSSATGVWGPEDAIQDGESGLVYPAGDIDALAGCLRRLLDQQLRARLSRAGRIRALRHGPRDFAAATATALLAVARQGRYAVVR